MNLGRYMRRVVCSACQWERVWGPEEMLCALRQLGMLRRAAHPATDMIVLLAESRCDQFACEQCHQMGLEIRPFTDDFDDPSPLQVCQLCGRAIPAERLEIFPDATRCARCQDLPDEPVTDEDFCPRCGGQFYVQLKSGVGLTRYQRRCPDCGYRECDN